MDIDDELESFGVVDNCDCPYDEGADDSPCVVCEERVKFTDHTHFKGQLFHVYCLLLALLRQLNGQPKEGK